MSEKCEACWAPPAGSDTDPVEAHQAAAADVVMAFAAADLDAAELTLPDFGGRAFPARQAMSFHAIDYLVHAWDVGASIGVPVRPDDDLLPAALDISPVGAGSRWRGRRDHVAWCSGATPTGALTTATATSSSPSTSGDGPPQPLTVSRQATSSRTLARSS